MTDAKIPQRVRDADAEQRSGGASGDPEGFFVDGRVFLVASALNSDADVVRVLQHEALGHAGLRGLYGKALTLILEQIANVRRAEVAKKAREYGLDPENRDHQLIAAEEILAVMAQTNPQLGFVRKAIAAIRQWLRDAGVKIAVTDDDIIAQFILPARAFVESGAAPARVGEAVMASRGAGLWSSVLSQAVDRINARAMPAAGWLQQINALTTKGVKPDEIEWSGIREWLGTREGKVPKDDVVAFLAANGVRITETVLGGEANYVDPESGEEFPTSPDDNPPKFGAYTLPGGTNYREVLLTLPPAERKPRFDVVYRKGKAIIHKAESREAAQAWIDGHQGIPAARGAEIVERARGQVAAPEYKSGHWDTPNVLAHIRLNDRADADGARVLFVEEIQSDWGQEGKKKGFDKASTVGWSAKPNGRDWAVSDADGRVIDASVSAVNAEQAIERAAWSRNERAVPSAPFVGKTDAWVALALKRVIKMAADEGYDRVAFVNGEQSAGRYDLSKQISRVEFDDHNSGGVALPEMDGPPAAGLLRAFDLGGNQVIQQRIDDPSQIEDYVGKDVAKRLLESTPTRATSSGMGVRKRALRGLDLKVGGEGMKTFYDRILPNVAKDVLRRVGGKMGTVTIGRTWEQYLAKRGLTERDGSVFVGNLQMNEPGVRRQFQEDEPNGVLTQPGFDITPEMREKASGGMPMFSRATDAAKKAAADGARAIKGATLQSTWKRLHNAWVDKRPLSIQLLGRRQIVEVYEKLLPELRAYSNEMQQYDADKNESAAAADEIVTRWRKLKDADALAEVMHGATLNEFDPDRSKTARDLLTPEMREVHDGFQALTPEAQAVYREARDAYETHWNLVKKAIGERIERADISENDRRAMMEQYRDEFLKPIQGVYFPLARFGDYVITVKENGVTTSVTFAETMTEAQAEQARLQKAFPKADVGKIIKRKEFNAARDAVPKDFVRKLYETVDKTAGPDSEALKDAINQLYLTSLPDVSWAKHGIHRKGTPGYNKDARRAFAANMFHGGYHVAKLRHADVLQDYLRSMQEHVEAQRDEVGYDSVAAQQVIDEMVKRHDSTINPDNSPAANTATALGFVWYLGASPASALVNLSQTALVAYPIIAGKYGFGATQSALLKASKQAMQFKNDFRGKLAGDENTAIERAIREGLIDITQAHDLASISEGRDSQLHGALSPVMRIASKLFHEAEKFNRQATFLAAYRLAKGAGESAESAYDTARDLTYRGHFDYSSSNRARVMMGPVARVILLFKQYGQNMIYTLGRNAVLAAKGDRQALRTLSGILVAHGLAAGTLGLPMSSILFGLASLIGGSDDEPWDAEVAYRNYLADALGPTLGEIVARGVFRGVFPGDISARVGLDSLLVRDIDLTLSPGKVHQEILNAVLGPVAGIGVNMARGATDLAKGDVQRGVEAMLPKAIADGLKMVRYAQEGVKDRTGVDVLPEVNVRELLAQFAGFSPARAKEAYEGRRAALGKEEALKARHNELLADFARALTNNDDEARAETIDKIARFNELNPTFAITREGIKRSVQNRIRRQAEAQNGVYLPRKHRDLADEGRFANTQ